MRTEDLINALAEDHAAAPPARIASTNFFRRHGVGFDHRRDRFRAHARRSSRHRSRHANLALRFQAGDDGHSRYHIRAACVAAQPARR